MGITFGGLSHVADSAVASGALIQNGGRHAPFRVYVRGENFADFVETRVAGKAQRRPNRESRFVGFCTEVSMAMTALEVKIFRFYRAVPPPRGLFER